MKWSEVKTKNLPELFELAKIESNDLIELYDRDIRMLCLVTNKSEDYFNSLKSSAFPKYRIQLFKMIDSLNKCSYQPAFRIGGRLFTMWDSIKKITVAQDADIQRLHITEENYYSKIPYVVALFAEEKRGLFFWRKKLSYSQKVELFKELSADISIGCSLFFCEVSKQLDRHIQNYLESQITIMNNQNREEIERNINRLSISGDGRQ